MTHDRMWERKLVTIMLFERKEFGDKDVPEEWAWSYWDGLRDKFEKTAELTQWEMDLIDQTLFERDLNIYHPVVDPYVGGKPGIYDVRRPE